jgi:hypothetical protein
VALLAYSANWSGGIVYDVLARFQVNQSITVHAQNVSEPNVSEPNVSEQYVSDPNVSEQYVSDPNVLEQYVSASIRIGINTYRHPNVSASKRIGDQYVSASIHIGINTYRHQYISAINMSVLGARYFFRSPLSLFRYFEEMLPLFRYF